MVHTKTLDEATTDVSLVRLKTEWGSKMFKTISALAISAFLSLSAGGASQAQAFTLDSVAQPSASLIYVSDGCGAGWYRGPGGACHRYGHGPYPMGYYQPRPRQWNGCPPGYWHGPWGHCRDTPYHGRLPNGRWK
jgi:hypothetical protein